MGKEGDDGRRRRPWPRMTRAYAVSRLSLSRRLTTKPTPSWPRCKVPKAAERKYPEATGADGRPPSIVVAASVGAYLKSALAAEDQDEQEFEPDVTIWYEQVLYVPGYHSEAFLNHAPVTGVGSYSILLSDLSRPSAPLHHLQYQTVAYHVLLKQFSNNSVVHVSAVGAAVGDKDGARPPYLLATVTTNSPTSVPSLGSSIGSSGSGLRGRRAFACVFVVGRATNSAPVRTCHVVSVRKQ